jgi:hypothetical protein
MRFLKFGVIEFNRFRAMLGVTLFTPLLQKETYLIGMLGQILHQWKLSAVPGNYGYLIPNGNLLIAVNTGNGPPGLNAGGGRIQELDWAGSIWETRVIRFIVLLYPGLRGLKMVIH